MASHLRNGRRLEKAGDVDLKMRDIVQAGENMRDRERVAAQFEEIIMDTDPFEFENLCPAAGQHFLKGVRGATKVCVMSIQLASPNFAARPTRWTLPVGPLGSSLTMSTWRGTLKSATRPTTNRRMSCGVAAAGWRNTMADAMSSPKVGWGTANVTASATAGCSRSTSSTSRGAIFSPPRLMISRLRPTTNRYPPSSKKPWSPVLNQSPAK